MLLSLLLIHFILHYRESFEFMYARPWQRVNDFYLNTVRDNFSLPLLFQSQVETLTNYISIINFLINPLSFLLNYSLSNRPFLIIIIIIILEFQKFRIILSSKVMVYPKIAVGSGQDSISKFFFPITVLLLMAGKSSQT
jgi:hypothetical protein